MRTVLAAICIASIAIPQVAFAQHRHRGDYNHYSAPHHRHYDYRPRKPNYGALIGGAVAAGIIGAIIVDQYGRRCVKRVVDYDIYGNPIVETVC